MWRETSKRGWSGVLVGDGNSDRNGLIRVLVGCDVTADDPHGLVEKNLKLSDGRTVICVQNDRGNSISCNWEHAVK